MSATICHVEMRHLLIFHSGLKPTELFFHTVGEHEDMVDTAVVRLPRLGTFNNNL
ncbi:hypothetical protein OUZ56_020037 [Daphnia magna]|uniref:Uncharacterized protein n=1 Tax=Daphnia magna TaxID=35525 RepID=A0ABQ9ZEE1_9CRUS|nr:hypothetical protein OUZ56_020037 [Daphnia magna]